MIIMKALPTFGNFDFYYSSSFGSSVHVPLLADEMT